MNYSGKLKWYLLIWVIASVCWVGYFYSLNFNYRNVFFDLLVYFTRDGLISHPKKLLKILAASAPLISLFLIIVYFTNIYRPIRYRLYYAYGIYFIIHFAVFYWWYSKQSSVGDDSLLEQGTVIAALTAAVLLAIASKKQGLAYGILSVFWLIFALEEISWGQRLLGFQSPEFFDKLNYQRETNLHNFFNPIIPGLYAIFNLMVFLGLTCLHRIPGGSILLRIRGTEHLMMISDKFGLWIIPLLNSFASIYYPGGEYVEEQWGLFGIILGFTALKVDFVVNARELT